MYQHNNQAKFDTSLPKINLAGILTGNSCADWDFDGDVSSVETLYRFSFIPERMWNNYNKWGCEQQFRDVNPINSTTNPDDCEALEDKIWGENGLVGALNPYDLYRY